MHAHTTDEASALARDEWAAYFNTAEAKKWGELITPVAVHPRP